MNKKITLFFLAAAALSAAACQYDDAELRPLSEFGMAKKEYKVGYKSGSIEVEVLSNEHFTLRLLERDLDWISFPDGQLSFDGDAKIAIDYATNGGYPRLAEIELMGETRGDTLRILQEGFKAPTLKFSDVSLALPGGGGEEMTPLNTNLDVEDIVSEVVYANEDDPAWISDIAIENGFLIFKAAANPNESALRRANITLSFTDGWGEVTRSTLLLTQANAKNEFGTLAPFASVRDMQGTVNQDIFIEGIVINDHVNQNAGENPRLTVNSIDYTGEPRTAYLESEDGKYGFMIQTKTAADNVFERYSKVRLLLRGANVDHQLNPERFIITGVTADMVLSSTGGTAADVPVKEKHIAELTDDDMYTWVKLLDCEFGMKKGPLSPCNDGYAGCFTSPTHYISKFPLLVIDNQGKSLYTFTNTTCPYRRDGRQLPYGSGSLSGVIVHESFDQFSWNGDFNASSIGDYQIRHLEWEDIAFEKDRNQSPVGYVVEYQYAIINNNVLNPTDGANGYLTHSHPDPSTGATVHYYYDWTYLGPCDQTTYSTVHNGNGVYLPDGSMLCKSPKTNWPAYPNTADGNRGKGQVDIDDHSAWRHIGNWWNTETDKPEAWLLTFSTKGLVTDHLSIVFSAGGMGYGSPRHFNLEWNTVSDIAADGWQHIAEFSTPENCQWGSVREWQMPGCFKQMSFELPLEMLDKDEVWIRFIPSRNASGSAQSYDGAEITSNQSWCMNYLAVRYAK